ncbi:MAG: hypothetical protein ACXAC7_22685 [Candidatus Hodarchaeales archaeon]|jgi:hypothetical protein
MVANEKGSAIYCDPNYECEFCMPPKRGMTVFFTCLNPELNYHFKKLGSWVLSCPADNEVCKYVLEFSGDDYTLISNFIEANDDKSKWMMIDDETIQYVISQLKRAEMHYFLWFMKFMGWQQYIDKDDELDDEGIIFTQTKIDVFERKTIGEFDEV